MCLNTINHSMSILHSPFHQDDERFNIDSRGKQYTGIAAVACVGVFLLDPIIWTISDLITYSR